MDECVWLQHFLFEDERKDLRMHRRLSRCEPDANSIGGVAVVDAGHSHSEFSWAPTRIIAGVPQ